MHLSDQDEDIGEVLVLKPRLDSRAAEELLTALRDRILAGLPVVLLGKEVEAVATLSLQVMATAARAAEARRSLFCLRAPSEVLSEAISALGLDAALPIESAI